MTEAPERTIAEAAHVAGPSGAASSHQFVCSEVSGGNRQVETLVALPGLRGKLYSHPVGGGRGGDVHYLSACDSGILARACLADVAGHGDMVATVSGEIHRLLRKFVNWSDQRAFMRALNRRLSSGDLGVMTTVAALSYYPPNRSLSVSYAGHPPALYYEARGRTWEVLSPPAAVGLSDLPMGVDAESDFARRRVRATPGDRVALFTDGVLEAPRKRSVHVGARTEQHAELFGLDRVQAFLDGARDLTPSEQVDGLVARVVDFTGDPLLRHDDVSILVLEIVASEGGPMLWKALRNRVILPLLGRPKAAAR